MNTIDYLHLQLRLEGKSVIGKDSLRQVEVVPDEDIPLMLIAQLADHRIIAYYDEALPPELHAELAKQIQNITFPKIEPLFDILKTQSTSFEVGHHKTYVFPSRFAEPLVSEVMCLSRQDPKIEVFGFDGFAEHVYAIERTGRIVSGCVSTRENKFCGEAWVFTNPEYRRQGLAQKVVSTWARGLILAGKVPFYSHKMQNSASANLAKRLELQPIFEEIVISYTNVSSL